MKEKRCSYRVVICISDLQNQSVEDMQYNAQGYIKDDIEMDNLYIEHIEKIEEWEEKWLKSEYVKPSTLIIQRLKSFVLKIKLTYLLQEINLKKNWLFLWKNHQGDYKMKKMNIDEVIKYHCQTKKVLTDIYNHLKKEIEYKEQLMKKN